MSNALTFRRLNPLSIVLLAAIAALIGYQSAARRPTATPAPEQAPGPMLIAAFDLEKTFNSLEEKKAADADLQRIADGMKKQTDADGKVLKTMETELEDLQAGTPKHKELMENLVLKTHEYQAQIEFFKAKIDVERARMMKQVYMNIRKAAEQLAKERGYAIVFVDDSIAPIPPGTEEEINRQISARRMVYVNPQVSVTEELISRMNNAFKMAGPAKQ